MPQVPKILSPHHKRTKADVNGYHGSLSVQSLTASKPQAGVEEEGGAYIPDIRDSRRNPSLTNSVPEYVTSPVTYKKDWAAKASPAFMDPRTPNSTSYPESSQHKSDQAPAGLIMSTRQSAETYRDAETRSPSTAPRSLLSRSTRSRANSSTSSLLYTHGGTLPPLQTKAAVDDGLEPLAEEEYDPASFDLVAPAHGPTSQYSLEIRSELLFSIDHLRVIFDDAILLQRFTNFICSSRPESVPLLIFYLDSSKALKAIGYANAISAALTPIDGLDFSAEGVSKTINESLLNKANRAFEILAREDLPAYITHTWVQTVSVTIKRRIADTLPVHLRDLSEGLAEVFCLTDPSRPDNPIVFASEEFHKTTQYGMGYVLGRNCRFLQGPKTNPSSVRRLRDRLAVGKEHCETFLNYRRDGSPFMNLLMVAPLYDSRGIVRYHIGAQVDVSGLVQECAGLEAFERLVGERLETSDQVSCRHHTDSDNRKCGNENKDEFRDLAEMFSLQELKTVRESGGLMHRTHQESMGDAEGGSNWHKPRLVIKDDAMIDRRDSDPILRLPNKPSSSSGGRLRGVYEHYLLVRPYPNLRILFASPSLRVPGILQSPFLSRVGGSRHVRDALAQAFADGNGVTAKIHWLRRAGDADGKARWIHCTPLLGANGAVGVWMVVLVDDEVEAQPRRGRAAPPVEAHIGGRGKAFDRPGGEEEEEDDAMSLSSFAVANRALDEHRPAEGLRRAPEEGAPGGGNLGMTPRPGTRTPRSYASMQNLHVDGFDMAYGTEAPRSSTRNSVRVDGT